jgi:hypothetical protein
MLLITIFFLGGELMFPIFHFHIGFLVHEIITLVGAMIDTWHIKT